jgi:hypothetical protein
MTLEESLADIARRNAGRPVLTVWKNGDHVVHGELDAEAETRGEPDEILLNIDIATMKAITFVPLQERTRMYERLLSQDSSNVG